MITRDRTNAFMIIRDALKMRKADIIPTDNEKTNLLLDEKTNLLVDDIGHVWLPYTETARTSIMSATASLKSLERLMSNFFIVAFDDEDDIKLQGITNMSKAITNQLNAAKNALFSSNAVPIRSKNKNEITIRQNIVSKLVKELDDCSRLFKSKQNTFMSKHRSMLSQDEFWI